MTAGTTIISQSLTYVFVSVYRQADRRRERQTGRQTETETETERQREKRERLNDTTAKKIRKSSLENKTKVSQRKKMGRRKKENNNDRTYFGSFFAEINHFGFYS